MGLLVEWVELADGGCLVLELMVQAIMCSELCWLRVSLAESGASRVPTVKLTLVDELLIKVLRIKEGKLICILLTQGEIGTDPSI